MNEVDRIVARLQRLHAGDAWHGSSVRDVLHGIDAQRAAARPLPQAHTIWEILLHMTAWLDEVRERLGGGTPGLPRAGDWPAVSDTSAAAWQRALDSHAVAHAALLAMLERFDASQLPRTVGGERERESGTGVSYEVMLHGLAEHEAYHSGQIGILKKAAIA